MQLHKMNVSSIQHNFQCLARCSLDWAHYFSSFIQYETLEWNCHVLPCQNTSASRESYIALKGYYNCSIYGKSPSGTTPVDFSGPHFEPAPTTEDTWASSSSRTLGFPADRSENTSTWQLKASREAQSSQSISARCQTHQRSYSEQQAATVGNMVHFLLLESDWCSVLNLYTLKLK